MECCLEKISDCHGAKKTWLSFDSVVRALEDELLAECQRSLQFFHSIVLPSLLARQI